MSQTPNVYRRTEAGNVESRTKALRLPRKMISLLLLVDGVRTVDQLRQTLSNFGDVDEKLRYLEDIGLIEPGGADARDAAGVAAVDESDEPGMASAVRLPRHAVRKSDRSRSQALARLEAVMQSPDPSAPAPAGSFMSSSAGSSASATAASWPPQEMAVFAGFARAATGAEDDPSLDVTAYDATSVPDQSVPVAKRLMNQALAPYVDLETTDLLVALDSCFSVSDLHALLHGYMRVLVGRMPTASLVSHVKELGVAMGMAPGHILREAGRSDVDAPG